MNTIYIMTHTHWDRDWFLTSEYINVWLDDLFERLFKLIERNPDYMYVLDGQTLILEDYLDGHPEKLPIIQELAQNNNLLIGPAYCQLDWRAVSEESLLRNLYYGQKDALKYGNYMPYGWLLDNFGHPSQSPQIHALFGIKDVYVWRGPSFPDDDIASEFIWRGSDGTDLTAHYLMSGYRNFYNLTDTTHYINLRIHQLTAMLEPFSPHKRLVFLDGYDNDAWPEDPFDFLDPNQQFVRASPETYARDVADMLDRKNMPVIQGELYSGKYACVFPGTLSIRSYLKVGNSLLENLMAYYLEPLQAMVSQAGVEIDVETNEAMWKALARTQLHDSLGGVSIDQVHKKMETNYQHLFDRLKQRITDLLKYLPSLLDLEMGTYAYLPTPFDYPTLWLFNRDKAHKVSSHGMGIYKISEVLNLLSNGDSLESFTWENDHYHIEISETAIQLNGLPVGELKLERDAGDTYNADPEPFLEDVPVTVLGIKLLADQEEFAKLALERELVLDGIHIRTQEEIYLDATPVVKWKVSVDSRGTNYRLRFNYATGDTDGQVYAKMPFDIYQRPRQDTNYFGSDTPKHLQPVLLAAREVGEVCDFPFQGFVAISGDQGTKAVFAKGLREYEADRKGRIMVTLMRSVEWLAKPDLLTRTGDAGPFMYVPGAKSERKMTFELAIIDVQKPVHTPGFLKWFYLFDYGFLIFENSSHAGKRKTAQLWGETLPWSGVHFQGQGKSSIRLYNPTLERHPLDGVHTEIDPFGVEVGETRFIDPVEIKILHFQPSLILKQQSPPIQTPIEVHFPDWPVGRDHSSIDDRRLNDLQEIIESYKKELSDVEVELSTKDGWDNELDYHRYQHAVYRLRREILEGEISLLLNALERGEDPSSIKVKLHDLGAQLNLARRERRTYDYILSLFENM